MLDQQAIQTMRPFDGPVAGQSLTASPESQQPYEGAPEFTNERSASEAIFASLLSDEVLPSIVDMLINGTPIGDITKMLLMSGLSQGKFNPDLMLLLVEPVMYMLLAIAEKMGIKDIQLYRGEEEDPEDVDTDILLNEQAKMRAEARNPSFSELKANVAPDQIPQELIEQLENIDVASLMSRTQQQPNDESLMSRR